MKYVRNFKTESEFLAAYNGSEYVEPWISYTKFEDGENVESIKVTYTYMPWLKIPDLSYFGEFDERYYYCIPPTQGTIDSVNASSATIGGKTYEYSEESFLGYTYWGYFYNETVSQWEVESVSPSDSSCTVNGIEFHYVSGDDFWMSNYYSNNNVQYGFQGQSVEVGDVVEVICHELSSFAANSINLGDRVDIFCGLNGDIGYQYFKNRNPEIGDGSEGCVVESVVYEPGDKLGESNYNKHCEITLKAVDGYGETITSVTFENSASCQQIWDIVLAASSGEEQQYNQTSGEIYTKNGLNIGRCSYSWPSSQPSAPVCDKVEILSNNCKNNSNESLPPFYSTETGTFNPYYDGYKIVFSYVSFD